MQTKKYRNENNSNQINFILGGAIHMIVLYTTEKTNYTVNRRSSSRRMHTGQLRMAICRKTNKRAFADVNGTEHK